MCLRKPGGWLSGSLYLWRWLKFRILPSWGKQSFGVFSTRSSQQNLERAGEMDWPLSPFLSALVSQIRVISKTVHWQPLLWVDEAIFSMTSLEIIPPRMYAFTSYFFVLLNLLFFLFCFVRVVIFPFNILCFWWIWKVDDSLFKKNYLFLFYGIGCFTSLRSMHHIYAWCPWRP